MRTHLRTAMRSALVTGLAVTVAPIVSVVAAAPAGAVPACPAAPYGVHRYAPGTGKTVALTFDDGPGLDTGLIISILRSNHVPATFFNLGANERNRPAYVSEELRAGFALGNHTWNHPDLVYDDAAQQAGQMDSERSEQASITGAYPCLFRPPYGDVNATTLQLAQRRGMAVWNWSVDTEDWKADGSGAAYWADRIASRAEAGGSMSHPVVLMHNQPGGNPATVAALPRIIAYYRSHGYRFVDLLGRSGGPAISAMSSHSGGTGGGTPVTITGSNFFGVQNVTFGGVPAGSWRLAAPGRIVATSPPHASSYLPVRVVTTFGTSAWVPAASFEYGPRPAVTAMSTHVGSLAGGTVVTISGAGFGRVLGVTFDGTPASSWRVVAPGEVSAVAPPHAAGVVPVRVTTPFGTSVWYGAASFRYE